MPRTLCRSRGHIEISAEIVWVGHAHPSGLRAGRYVRLAVSDDGQGMPADVLARATDPFFTTRTLARARGWDWPWSMDWPNNPTAA